MSKLPIWQTLDPSLEWVKNKKYCAEKFTLFSKNLKIIRKYRGFTQKELAKRTNLSAATISSYERGAASPSLDSVLLLERELNTTLYFLFNSNS